MAYLDTVLEKLFCYEGIPEIMLNFFTPIETYKKGSKEIQKILEIKYRTVESGNFGGRNWTDTRFMGKLHSFNDEPARISEVMREWYYLGLRHRGNDEPAVIYSNDNKEWWDMDEITGWTFGLEKFYASDLLQSN